MLALHQRTYTSSTSTDLRAALGERSLASQSQVGGLLALQQQLRCILQLASGLFAVLSHQQSTVGLHELPDHKITALTRALCLSRLLRPFHFWQGETASRETLCRRSNFPAKVGVTIAAASWLLTAGSSWIRNTSARAWKL